MESQVKKLWDKFHLLEKELESLKGQPSYAQKKLELLDLYEKIQQIESKMLQWSTVA